MKSTLKTLLNRVAKLEEQQHLSYVCHKDWNDLKELKDEKKRFCDTCQRHVHPVYSEEELQKAGEEGKCVYLLLPEAHILLGEVSVEYFTGNYSPEEPKDCKHCAVPTDPRWQQEEIYKESIRLTQASDFILLQVQEVDWPHPHTPSTRWKTVKRFEPDDTAETIYRTKRTLLRNPDYFRTCKYCQQLHLTGHMHDDTCHSCAEKFENVVH